MLGYGTYLSITKTPKLDCKLTTAFTANDQIPGKNVIHFPSPVVFQQVA